MFVAELGCFIFALIVAIWNKAEKENTKNVTLKQKILFSIPGICDVFASTLGLVGLTMTSASAYQMMKTGTLIWTFLFTKLFLKKEFRYTHYLGIFLVVIGLMGIGIASIIWSKPGGTPTTVLGISLVAIGQIFTAIQIIIEEKIFNLYNCCPLQAVGMEGITGFLITGTILIMFNNISCETQYDSKGNAQFCGNGVLEDSIFAFKQIGECKPLALFVFGYMLAMLIQQWAATAITKYGSSLQRSILSCLRSLGVWIGSLIIGWENFIWFQVFLYKTMHKNSY